MRPGLAVSISSDSGDTLQGSISKVDRREAVVVFGAERAALAAMLKPSQAVRIAYRNQDDGAVYFVPAEVKAKDGPRSLALKLLGPPVLGEDRDHPRVEQLLRMRCEVVPPDDVERARHEILHGAQIVKYEAEAPGMSPRVVDAPDEPLELELPIARHLRRIERKLDALLDRLGIDGERLEGEKPLFNVSLSPRGVRFRDIDSRCTPGDTVRLAIELPLSPTVEVVVLGEVLHTVDTSTGARLSTGRDVVIEFRLMKNTTRAALERFCQLHVGARRTA